LNLTGITREEFDYLADEFKQEWDVYISCYTPEEKQR